MRTVIAGLIWEKRSIHQSCLFGLGREEYIYGTVPGLIASDSTMHVRVNDDRTRLALPDRPGMHDLTLLAHTQNVQGRRHEGSQGHYDELGYLNTVWPRFGEISTVQYNRNLKEVMSESPCMHATNVRRLSTRKHRYDMSYSIEQFALSW